MTDSWDAQHPLARRAARLEAILENAVDPILTMDDQGTIDFVNPATLSVFGYARDEMIGNNVKMLMPPCQAERGSDVTLSAGTDNATTMRFGREVLGQRKDGSTFPMELAIREATIDGQRCFTGIVRDLTQREKSQHALKEIIREKSEQLRAAESELINQARLAALGQTFGGIAHEIRSPLNALKTSAYYLRNARRPGPAKIQEHLNRIDRQVKVIESIVTALSNMATLPAPDLNPVSLDDWIPQAAGEIELTRNVHLSIQLPPELPKVLVDVTQVPIALKNLVRNARDAMPHGGTITISAQAYNGFVGILVADSGEGISEEVLPKIMEPLFSTKPSGMGLGLTICRAIVEKNRGKIEVQSKYGEGTTFTIYLRSAPPVSPG